MKKALFRQTQKTARRAPHTSNTHTTYQTPLAVKEQTRKHCLRYTPHFDRLALRPIEASAPQNWGTLSTTSPVQILQSWGESVSISRSYDRGDFRGRYTTPKNRIFVSARSRLYRRFFRFSLHFRVEYALISPLTLKNFGITSTNKFKNLKTFLKKYEKQAFSYLNFN